MSNEFDRNYQSLTQEVIATGTYKQGRNGGMVESFGVAFPIDLTQGFPLSTLRKLYPKGVFGELAAFLDGSSNVAVFQNYGCNYWNDFADEDDGDLGPIYGSQWRAFDGLSENDQIEQLVDTLDTEPNSRRMIVTAANPTQEPQMCLPPCHFAFQANVQNEHLNLIVYQRSLDLMLGFPADVILYASLVELLCNSTQQDLLPGRLVFMVGSAHIYAAHLGQAVNLLAAKPEQLPDVSFGNMTVNDFDPFAVTVQDYNPGPALNFELFT
jgi:thymidylate synthase